MKISPRLLLAFVGWLVTTASGYFDKGARPHLRPTALRGNDQPTAEHTGESLIATDDDFFLSDSVDSSQFHSNSRTQGAGGAVQLAADEPAKNTSEKTADDHARSAADLTGVRRNEHGQLSTTLIACFLNMTTVVLCMLAFSALRMKFPLMYSGNVVFSKIAPLTPNPTFLGWFGASLSISTDIVADSLGLDAALLVEFCTMACKILATVGLPMMLFLCPLHFWYGGRGGGIDEMSSMSMGNVILSHPWMYHLHAVIVNLVTFVVMRLVYASMPNFLSLRYKWLKNMSAPRCFTVLVEGIPEGWRSDAKLKEYFTTVFTPEHVIDCVMVKDAPVLLKVFDEETEYKELLKDYKDKWSAAKHVPEDRPLMRERMCIGKQIDAIEYLEKKLAELKPRVEIARATALAEAEIENEHGINCSTGFVTFARRREADVCLNIMSYSSHKDEWIVSTPPPASDVRWNDLKQPEMKKRVLAVIGYLCILMLFILFLPIVVAGTNLSNVVRVGFFQPIWDSFAPGLALMLFLMFLPTVCLLIFSTFFNLKSEIFGQHKLQIWYFGFMVFFVILVTIIGKSLIHTFAEVVQQPATAFALLAENMPGATQFYMDFLMLQWGEQAMNFLRLIPLIKYMLFKTFYEDEDAKRMAEPEDQDFYGIGSRSARFTISLLIGIIFCTLSPLMPLMALILFGLMRVYYGYLVVFAEVKKPDLGGVFYHQQLQHLIMGMGVYNALMIGVLWFRSENKIPMLMTVPSLLYTLWSYWHFSEHFVWKDLPFAEVCSHPEDFTAEDNGLRYIQPEFADPSRPHWLKRSIEWLSDARWRTESGSSSANNAQ